MPAVTFNLYDKFRQNQQNGGNVDLDSPGGNGLKMAIVTGAYTVDQNLHDFWDDVSANEVSGTGYTAGGNACANPTVTLSGAGLVTVDADDPAAWSQNGAGFSNGRRVIWYHDTGTPSTSCLIGFSNDFGEDKGNVAGNFTVAFDAAGAFTNPR